MTSLTRNVWELLSEEFSKLNHENPNIIFDTAQKDKFEDIFLKSYKNVLERYMDKSVKNLDRHKVAAIIIISLLEVKPISYVGLDNSYIFIGNELTALKIGLAYMCEMLNEKLSKKGITTKLEQFDFPNAQSCDTSYMNIMCRNLYYAETDYVLNPLDLADRLFLIEYIALSKNGIDPDILKD